MAFILLTKGQKVILTICGVIIVLGSIILLIDKFIVKRGEPTRDESLATVQQELGFELHDPYSQAGELMHVSKRFEMIAPPADDIGAVMVQRTDDHEMFLYEHKYDQRALRGATQTHSMSVELFGILFRLPGANLPDVFVLPDGSFSGKREDLEQVYTPEAVERLKSWKDFAMGTSGEFILYIQRPPSNALVAASQRNTSADFQPGLLNSGLKVDVQRAIDITNMLKLDRPEIASVYTTDIGEIDVNVDVPELDLGLDKTVKETHDKVDAIMAESDKDMAEFREKMARQRAEREAEMEQRRAEREAKRAQQQAQWDAEREQRNEALRKQREKNQAEHEARMQEQQRILEERLKEIEEGSDPDG